MFVHIRNELNCCRTSSLRMHVEFATHSPIMQTGQQKKTARFTARIESGSCGFSTLKYIQRVTHEQSRTWVSRATRTASTEYKKLTQSHTESNPCLNARVEPAGLAQSRVRSTSRLLKVWFQLSFVDLWVCKTNPSSKKLADYDWCSDRTANLSHHVCALIN